MRSDVSFHGATVLPFRTELPVSLECEAWRRFVTGAGVTAEQLGRIVAVYRERCGHGSALLARHRRRRHR